MKQKATKDETAEVPDHRQTRAIALMVEGTPIEEVARTIGISRTQFYRWRTSPAFAGALAEAQRTGLDAAKARLLALREKAIDAIEAVLSDALAPPAVKIRAAELVFDRSGLVADDGTKEPDALSQQDMRDAFRELARQFPEILAEMIKEQAS